MSEKKYVVPKDGLKAAEDSLFEYSDLPESSREVVREYDKPKMITALEAFIQWQSSRSPKISAELLDLLARDAHVSKEVAYDIVDIALRRMYLVPDPEVPEEIKDLIQKQGCFNHPMTNVIIKAFRRGQKSTK